MSVLCESASTIGAAPTPGPLPNDVTAGQPANALPPAGQVESAKTFIKEYRVEGAHKLSRIEIEEAVYPFLGPGRTAENVEQARAALEDAYRAKGYQTVSVQIPPQQAAGGVVILQVLEAPVGRLRVKGSRYFSPKQIKKEAPSLAEGAVPDFGEVTRDIVALNQLADRKVTPSLRTGVVPGTVDIDLEVRDTFPLHGSVELNNRYSPDTTQLRVNGAISYNNLWQLGHSVGFSFQLAPERLADAEVFSGYYLARVPGVSWLSLIVQGTKQDSNVSTLGGAAVAGRGEIIGGGATVALPAGKNFYHSFNFGLSYKHFDQNLRIGDQTVVTPITYYPLTATYSATWAEKGSATALNVGLTFAVRGTGSNEAEFDFNRFEAGGNFFYLRGDLGHTHDLPKVFQIFGKIAGQVSDQPLVNSEQFSLGGLVTVRGYLESEVLGDNAVNGSLELRSPSLLRGPLEKNEWRLYAFAEGGAVFVEKPLPDQHSSFHLASLGIGTHLLLFGHVNASLDFGLPLISQTTTDAFDPLLIFRVWADF
jgi:hemolysin activation/secretion protein